MRHRKSGRKLKRTASHRRATLGALAAALLRHKRITTTVTKAKETRMVVEKLITRAKNAVARKNGDAGAVSTSAKPASARGQQFEAASGHARREVGRLIKDRAVVSELFSGIAEKVAARPGGYTRIVKLGQRQGDGAEMAVIELVDYNTGKETKETPAPAKEKKPRSPRKATKGAGASKAQTRKDSAKKTEEKAPVGKKDPKSSPEESH